MVNNNLCITYNIYATDITLLYNKIVESNKKISGVYGIPRGGLPIAVHLSHHLNVPLINEINESTDMNTLVVDDVADTGVTLLDYTNFTIATLYKKPRSFVTPSYYGREVSDSTWVVFPWERG